MTEGNHRDVIHSIQKNQSYLHFFLTNRDERSIMGMRENLVIFDRIWCYFLYMMTLCQKCEKRFFI